MEIKDVGSNSFRSRESKETKRNEDDTKHTPRLAKVASGVKMGSSGNSKIMDIFFPDGINAEDIWEYLLKEKIAPGIMSGVRSFLDDFLDAVFGTPTRRDRDRDRYRRENYVPYTSLYNAKDKDRDRDRDKDRYKSYRKAFTYDKVVFRTRAEAESVLDALLDALDEYHIVTVADLYDLSGEEPSPTDYLYGWSNLRSARVDRVSGGAFTIILPKASPIG